MQGISCLRSLRLLSLVYLPSLETLPPSITTLSALECLHLRSATAFQGPLPDDLSDMQRLRELQLPLLCPGAEGLQAWVDARGGAAALQAMQGLSVTFHAED